MSTPPVCDYEGSDYQREFWENADRAYEDAAEELALSRLLPARGAHLLELGAGAGRNTPRYTGFERITLLDYSTTQLKQAREKLGDSPRYRFFAADVYRLPFGPGSFDAATMIRTLHHLADPNLALQQMRACLTGDAVFILEFANKRNLKAVLRYAAGRQGWNPFSSEAVEFVELNFDFHPASVKEILRGCGFEIQRQISVSYLRSGLLKRVLPLRAMTALEAVLQHAFSWSAYSPSIFLLARASGDQAPTAAQYTLRCAACGQHPLADTPPLISCPSCGRGYPVVDGIYDFRLEKDNGKE
jgi:SAM-dependent methyltransferase